MMGLFAVFAMELFGMQSSATIIAVTYFCVESALKSGQKKTKQEAITA